MNKPQQLKQSTSEIWSQYLQRRVMRLLLLHDQQLFRGQFAQFFTGSSLPALSILQFYDQYLKLLILSDELLNDILPRIRLQLSLQIDQIALQEEAPTRGEIDWPRTIDRAINETPDLPPQLFETRQRRQHINAPENLFFAAILLQHLQLVREVLRKDQDDELFTDAERQQLVSIEEALERELATPDVRLLREAASHSEIERLVEQVTTRLRPGAGPYRDLLTWWDHFNALHIGQSRDQRHLTLASIHGNEQDAWLYELWIALELLTFLQENHAVQANEVEIQRDHIRWFFTWDNQRYRFRYQRRLAPLPGEQLGWEQVPAFQPSYLIEHETPSVKIEYENTLIWQDPPFPITAAYAADSSSPARLSLALQELSGGLYMYNAFTGILCFPLLADSPTGQQFSGKVKRTGKQHPGGMPEQSTIHLLKMTPDLSSGVLQQRLLAFIRQAVASLPEREQPACHGIMLDADSVNDSGDVLPAYNVLCPKPHIGPGVFDLVHRDRHCLKDPRLCHVMGKMLLPPRITRVNNINEMKGRINELRTYGAEALQQANLIADETKSEQLQQEILQNVGNMIEQYVRARGNTAPQEKYFRDGFFRKYWKQDPRCLAEETRNILLSGEYVWDEYQDTDMKDWAAPAVQYCRALEAECKRRLHDHYPNYKTGGFDLRRSHGSMTLGAVTAIYSKRDGEAQHNWNLFMKIVTLSRCDSNAFVEIMKRMEQEQVSNKRNDLAHGGHISYDFAQQLRDVIVGKNGILCWIAEHLEPKK